MSITTALALRPLGWIRVLRKYVTVAVVIALGYLVVQLLRHPLPAFGHGTWNGFWIAVDTVVGVAVSFVPLASDYSRHSRSARRRSRHVRRLLDHPDRLLRARPGRAADGRQGRPDQIFSSFMAVPLGTLAFAVLAIRELDQSFADTYSTAVSMQNLRPRWDRRGSRWASASSPPARARPDINDYENFLILIGSVFVPLLGVLVVD